MPFDSTPRSRAALISHAAGQSRADRAPRRTFMPARTFGAPQTICTDSSRRSMTWQTLSFSAFGCRAHSTTSPTRRPRAAAPRLDAPSTSSPAIVSRPRVRASRHDGLDPFAQPGFAELHRPPARNCSQEAQVVLEVQPDVVDAVAQHRQALDAHAERVAGIALGVDADVRSTLGCTTPQPSTSSQPVCLQTRQPAPLQNTHSMSTSADGSVNGKYDGRKRMPSGRSKNCSHEAVQHRLQIREAHALVDDQPFDLVEHRRVGHVRVAAIDAARHDHAQRRLVAQHARICTGEVCVRSSRPSGK